MVKGFYTVSSFKEVLIFLNGLFISLFLTTLGLCCCLLVFSSYGKGGYVPNMVHRLFEGGSLVEHRF